MPKAKTAKEQIAQLKAENRRLKRQISSLKRTRSKKKTKTGKWRAAIVVVLAGLAGGLLVASNILFWTGRTLIDNTRYTNAVESLIQQPAVQTKIADKTTQAIFDQVNVAQLLEETLPPRAQFAAPSLAGQVESYTNDKAKEVVASPEFQEVWVSANSKAHQKFIDFLRNYEGDGTIDLDDVYARLADNLKDSKLSFLTNVQLPDKIGSIQVIDAPNLQKAHWLVANFDSLRLAAILTFLLLSILVVVLARNRRRVAVRLGLLFASLMFVSLIAGRIAREIIAGDVSPDNKQVFLEAWQALLQPLVLQTSVLLMLGLIVAFVAWVTGSGKNAKHIQMATDDILNGKIHKAIFGSRENALTKWVGARRAILKWLVISMAFIGLLVINISLPSIVIWAGVTLVALGSVQILAANR